MSSDSTVPHAALPELPELPRLGLPQASVGRLTAIGRPQPNSGQHSTQCSQPTDNVRQPTRARNTLDPDPHQTAPPPPPDTPAHGAGILTPNAYFSHPRHSAKNVAVHTHTPLCKEQIFDIHTHRAADTDTPLRPVMHHLAARGHTPAHPCSGSDTPKPTIFLCTVPPPLQQHNAHPHGTLTPTRQESY